MGLYYNPNPPHIGAQQPLEQRKLTPPQSGPAPQNPPFRGSYIGTEILVAWAVAISPISLPPKVIPQAAVATNPPFVGTSVGQAILNHWNVPVTVVGVSLGGVPPQVDATPLFKNIRYEIVRSWDAPPPAPIVAINLDPPISGPTPQNPPIRGARVSQEVLVAWLPLPTAPIVAVNLDPPQSAPPSFFPYIGSKIGPEVLVSWLPPASLPIVGPKFTNGAAQPTNPPFRGTWVPSEVHVAWIPPPPTPMLNVLSTPPTGPAPPPVSKVRQRLFIANVGRLMN